jgi:hypothetical protein
MAKFERLIQDHKLILALSHEIRKESVRKTNLKRLKVISKELYEKHLSHHFEFEERYIFPILGLDHPLVKQALLEHQRIADICTLDDFGFLLAKQLLSELEGNIHFEEKVIFPYILQVASAKQLVKLEKININIPQ